MTFLRRAVAGIVDL